MELDNQARAQVGLGYRLTGLLIVTSRRRRAVAHAMRDPDGLTLRQRAFLQFLTTPATPEYLNFTRAYLKAYQCQYESANANSARLIARDSVRAAMSKMWDVGQLGAKLKRYVNKLEKSENIKDAANVVMSYAELTGQLIRKSETKITDEHRDEVRELLRELVQPPAPTTPSGQQA